MHENKNKKTERRKIMNEYECIIQLCDSMRVFVNVFEQKTTMEKNEGKSFKLSLKFESARVQAQIQQAAHRKWARRESTTAAVLFNAVHLCECAFRFSTNEQSEWWQKNYRN